MKLMTRDTDYAVRAVCAIAKGAPEITGIPALVKELGMPRPFLRKLLQALSRNNILRSSKGAGGGFVLARAPQKIYLLDIMRIFQGTFSLNECLFRKKACPDRKTCMLRREIKGIEEYAAKKLGSITIASLLERK